MPTPDPVPSRAPGTAPDVPAPGGSGGTAPAGTTAPAGRLVVRPFRALRYDPARVSDLAAVTSPPYDVIDPDSATHLEDLDPHNVVRLILPRDDVAPGSRYELARHSMEKWVTEGVLRRDERPALYVYEQRGHEQSGYEVRQRGLIATVGIPDEEDAVILPHEDVMPGPVADRLELMRATRANLEPILLVYDGGGTTAAVIDHACAGEPLLQTTTEEGLRQRLWAVTDPAAQAEVAADLAPRQALIADGHHRYATYRRLRAEHRAAGDGPGGWDLGLAMLVDTHTDPLRVQAIHRVVADLGLDEAVDRARAVFRARPAGADLASAVAVLLSEAGSYAYLLTDGARFVVVDQPAEAAVDEALPPGAHSPRWRSLDASLLHALLLDRLWEVDDTAGRIEYLHDSAAAVRAARRRSGVAVLLRPVTVATVQALAARGERMPRKSTSFGPKPRTGLVLRPLDD